MSSPKSLQDYLSLITSEHQSKPNFVATLTAVLTPLVQIQSLLAAMIDIFDLDLIPVGNQLDIIGQWVGVTRNLKTPIAGVFFTWDGSILTGWDSGSWQSNQTQITVLPDDAYLTLINARIAINAWNGTIEGAYDIWATVLPQYNLLIFDAQNMSFIAAIQGVVPDAITQALFTGGYLVPKPEGVRISAYVIPADTGPLFAWDVDSSSMAGWDTGSWGEFLAPT